MIRFVSDLFDTGRVQVSLREDVADADLSDLIRQTDRFARDDMPGDAPPLSVAAAGWALAWLVDACRFLVYRDLDAAVVQRSLAHPCPEPPSASVCYSADLFLRFVPDLIRLANAVGTDDPLVDSLHRVAAAWPLSGVGVNKIAADDSLRPVLAHPALIRLYVDRIIARHAVAELANRQLADAVRNALGGYKQLAPELAKALEPPHG